MLAQPTRRDPCDRPIIGGFIDIDATALPD